MPKELSDLHLGAWRAFITAHANLIDAIDREMASAEVIPLNWYDVLVELLEAPERRLRMHELARNVVLSRSGLTRLVDRLEDAELLKRELDPADRRGFYAILTDKGYAALKKAWPVYAKGISRHFAQHLNNAQAQAITERLTRMVDAVREAG